MDMDYEVVNQLVSDRAFRIETSKGTFNLVPDFNLTGYLDKNSIVFTCAPSFEARIKNTTLWQIEKIPLQIEISPEDFSLTFTDIFSHAYKDGKQYFTFAEIPFQYFIYKIASMAIGIYLSNSVTSQEVDTQSFGDDVTEMPMQLIFKKDENNLKIQITSQDGSFIRYLSSVPNLTNVLRGIIRTLMYHAYDLAVSEIET